MLDRRFRPPDRDAAAGAAGAAARTGLLASAGLTLIIPTQFGTQRAARVECAHRRRHAIRQVEQSMIDISAGIPGLIALPHLQSMTIAGPMSVDGVSETPSRGKIFICRPASDIDERRCGQQIIAALARQAYRREPTDAEAEPVSERSARSR